MIVINAGRLFGRLSVVTVLALASVLRAEDQTPLKLPLDELLATPIKTAAKYEQPLSSVAASVTVISGEEIERYGWTSLPEVLQSIPGFYVTYDRNYAYIGVRGIGRPTDYNTRIMVLRNGIVLNGELLGAPMPEFDFATIDRIEIVRGPGSALYGSEAMLAVVNIITKGADAIDGVGGSVMYGSRLNEGGTVRIGKTLSDGLRVTASGYWRRSRGADLYFPEFNSPANNNGVAKGLDYEELHDLSLGLEKGKLHLTAYLGSRTKGIPAASYDTLFNVDSSTVDKHTLLAAEYEVSLGVGKTLELRGSYDNTRSRGFYPYGPVGVENWLSTRYGTEARFNWDVRPNHRLTAGTEVSRSHQADYTYFVGDYGIHLHRPYTRSSFYLQDEYHPSTRLGIVGGVRYDHYPFNGSSASPRAAILYTPTRSTTVKFLYGTAFRAPTLYESGYNDPLTPWKVNPDLQSEKIRTTELVLEQRVRPEVFFVGSLFRVGATNLINEQVDPTDSVLWYRNIGSIDSSGGEMSLELRKENGVWGHLGFSTQTTKDRGHTVDNSPRTMIKAGLSSSPRLQWHGGFEAIYESSRLTRDGATTSPWLLLNGTITRNLGGGLQAGVIIRNLLNSRYSTPVGAEFVPQSIVQNGRTLALKLSYSR
jgi:outer membrane receptor protein involved in Fe transport